MKGAKKTMKKKYTCVVKVDAERFVKYHSQNLVDFTAFLDRDFPTWRFFNVFDSATKQQVASYTKNRRPTSAQV